MELRPWPNHREETWKDPFQVSLNVQNWTLSWLFPDRRIIDELLGIYEIDPALPGTVREALTAGIFHDLGEALSQWLAVEVRVLHMEGVPEEDARWPLGLLLQFQESHFPIYSVLKFPPSAESLISRVFSTFKPGDPMDLSGLPLQVALVVGSSGLTPEEAESLEPGDVILLRDHLFGPERGTLFRVQNQIAFPAQLSEDGQQITIMSNQPTTDETTSFPTKAMTVQLDFEVGTLKMPLKELEALQEGYIFTFPERVDEASPVTIRCHGEVIGEGELVVVGTRSGVRITSFSKATP